MVPQRILRPILAAIFAGLVVATWIAGRRPEGPGARSDPSASSGGWRLRDVARESGLEFTHQAARFDARLEHIMPHVAGVGAAVSLVDADGDGRLDVYATSSGDGGRNALFVQDEHGRFTDRAAEAGLAELNRAGENASMGSIWADCDGDGDRDALVYGYGRVRLLRNEGGLRFRDVTDEAGLGRRMNCNAACWIDYDRDGWLDLYVTGYFREDVDLWKLADTRIMTESFEFAQNGGHNYLYRNLGDGRFADVTSAAGCDSTRWTFAVAAADFDGDGWQDIYCANDYGVEELFLNRPVPSGGGRRFERASGRGLEESSKSGMAVAVGDFLGDGTLGVYVTNISKAGYLFQGNNLRVNRLASGGPLQNVSEGVVADCGWAWGAQFGDLDNDGRVDLFVANGFRSANKERDYWYGMGKIATATGKLAADAQFWPPMEDRSLSGYERSRVLLNQGRMRFVDVAASCGVDDLDDGRAVAFGDVWSDGALDVLVANQSGRLIAYRGEPAPGRHWLRVRLRGKAPNTDAIGARATLSRGGKKQTQVVLAGSGFCAQNELALHFGLGEDATLAETAELIVRWPSGVEQRVSELQVDAVNEVAER